MMTRSPPSAAALSVSEPPRWAIWTCPESKAGMPVELTMLSSVTSSPFCLKMPASSASHSGRLSAIRLLYETCRATAGPAAAAGAVVAAGLAARALVGAALVAAGAVVGLAAAGCVGATAGTVGAAGLAAAGCVGVGTAGAGWHAVKIITAPESVAARRKFIAVRLLQRTVEHRIQGRM